MGRPQTLTFVLVIVKICEKCAWRHGRSWSGGCSKAPAGLSAPVFAPSLGLRVQERLPRKPEPGESLWFSAGKATLVTRMPVTGVWARVGTLGPFGTRPRAGHRPGLRHLFPAEHEGEAPEQQELPARPLAVGGCFCGSWLHVSPPQDGKPPGARLQSQHVAR